MSPSPAGALAVLVGGVLGLGRPRGWAGGLTMWLGSIRLRALLRLGCQGRLLTIVAAHQIRINHSEQSRGRIIAVRLSLREVTVQKVSLDGGEIELPACRLNQCDKADRRIVLTALTDPLDGLLESDLQLDHGPPLLRLP